MPSVTSPVVAALVTAMIRHIQQTAIPNLIFQKDKLRGAVGPLYDAAGNSIKLSKTGLTKLGPEAVGVGYTVEIIVANVTTYSYIWLLDPVDYIRVHRQAILDGLQQMIDNPNVGISTFNVEVPKVAARIA